MCRVCYFLFCGCNGFKKKLIHLFILLLLLLLLLLKLLSLSFLVTLGMEMKYKRGLSTYLINMYEYNLPSVFPPMVFPIENDSEFKNKSKGILHQTGWGGICSILFH